MPTRHNHTTKKRKRSILGGLFRIFMYTTILVILIGVGTIGVFLFSTSLPNIAELQERQVAESTKIYDRTGEAVLYELYNEERRTIVPFEDIPRNVKNATIAIEDSNFYKHSGISLFSIVRAIVIDLYHGGEFVQGGSTITQQFVKKTLLTQEKTLPRKIKEAILALKLERVYAKDEILEMYLNEIPYGSNAYGIEAAAQIFFGKTSKDITLPEAAYLAALPKAPTYYSPYGNHTPELENRKNTVLTRMQELGFISNEEKEHATKENVVFLPPSTSGIRSPHFVMYVVEQLEELYGEDVLQKQGFVVRTSLDINIQSKAEEVIEKHKDHIQKDFNAGNTGLVAIDPKTGEIVAMVGSRDYFDKNNDGNYNITTASRQPGSAFKPIVYAAALEKGFTPETVVFDVSTEFAVPGAESYQPQNYDSLFRGPVTFREALAQSINVPAVKVLYLTGITKALDMARRLGITTLAGQNQYGLTLVLGGGEVQLLQLTSAYGVFANDGVRNNPVSILEIKKADGEVVYKNTQKQEQAIDPEIARNISDILSDNTARAPAFGSASALYFPNKQIAAKTGTTNDYRDAWIIGYTPSISVGVWAGNNDNSPMEKRVAGFIVAPIWHDFMAEVLKTIPVEPFVKPKKIETKKPVLSGEWRGGNTYTVDKLSGKLATTSTPPEFIETRIVPEIHSILYWIDKNNPQGPNPTNPQADSQFTNWESGVRAWAEKNGLLILESTNKPSDTDDIHTEKNKPRIAIQTPTQNSSYAPDTTVPVRISVQSTFPIKQVDYFLNGVYVGSNNKNFENFVLEPSFLKNKQENFVLTVKAYDTM